MDYNNQNASGQYGGGPDQNPYGGGPDQNPYGGGADQNPYGGGPGQNPYGGYSYGNGSYNGNQGGVPLDKYGRPFKNNFGMKLAFSIIEMVVGVGLTCARSWCFGMIPLGLAIIACVMVCMQNKHYREGNWSSFLSAKRASNALMWVAFGFYIVFLVLVIVVVVIALVAGVSLLEELGPDLSLDSLQDIQNAYESSDNLPDFDEDLDFGFEPDDYDDDYDYDNDYDDYDDHDHDGSGSSYDTINGENLYIDGFNDFRLNGSRVLLPVDMENFLKAGFMLNDEDMETLIPAGSYDGYAYYDENGNYLGTVFVYNVTGKDLPVPEGIAGGITVNNYDGTTLELVNGITFDTPADEAVAALGNPTGTSGGDGDVTLEWYMNDRYGSSLEFDYWDGELSEVWIMNYLPLEN